MQKNRRSVMLKKGASPIGERWLVRLLVDGEYWKDVTGEMLRFGSGTPLLKRYWTFMQERMSAWESAHPESRRDTDEMTLEELRQGSDQEEAEVPAFLKEAHAKLCEREAAGFYEIAAAEANFRMLCEQFSLSECEAHVLHWVIWFSRSTDIRQFFNSLDYAEGGVELYSEVMSCATGMSAEDIRRALSPEGALMRSGLIAYGPRDNKEDIEDWFVFFDEELGCRLLSEAVTCEELLRAHLSPAPEATLELRDYERLPEVKLTLIPYLKQALKSGRTGVNVLLYGPPGTGKTELTRTLAQEIGATLWEVSTERSQECERLRHWRIADRLLGKADRACIVLDEAEDVFHSSLNVSGAGFLRTNKGEINESLETNAHPTFWVLNAIEQIDAAMMRRFDLVLEVPMPSVRERRRMVEKVAGDALSPGFCERLSRTEALSPAVLARAVKVADALSPVSPLERDAQVEAIVNAQLGAIGAGRMPKAVESQAHYSLGAVNADADLHALASGISRTRSARLCLYGEPGTGKTAWAGHLAGTLEMPLVAKRASDLLSCWVGMTEKNIAAAFQEAEREGAILLIDEADSFLQDRAQSRQSWEMTQVNEMLTQIEAFNGIFIATTNLIETLDAACLRRFDLKIRFDVLTFEQAKGLLADELEALALPAADARALEKLARIDNLTPGDFASVMRRARCLPVENALDFVERLASDCELKRGKAAHRRSIGF